MSTLSRQSRHEDSPHDDWPRALAARPRLPVEKSWVLEVVSRRFGLWFWHISVDSHTIGEFGTFNFQQGEN
ncbi:hypothetical protein E4U34_003265 [Claviceps purpurea]|nr:hypothetical protein E4U34_003265 [Claviceps purpurea]KAG6251941.1 hypothetical protein E4U23_000131 [Claviceps purpurea]